MKVKYTFVTGEISEIEVTEELGAEIMDMEKTASNKERAETRRHQSLDAMEFESKSFADQMDVASLVMELMEQESLEDAISHLLPQQIRLIRAIFFEGMTVNDFAAQEGVDHSAISHRLRAAFKQLKKYFR